jgi:hypothetical protein
MHVNPPAADVDTAPCWASTWPYAAGSVYTDFLTQDEGARIREAYGPNWDRLVQVKQRYDPTTCSGSRNIRG